MAGSSNRDIKYECTRCGDTTQRELLTAKRVAFQTMGVKFKTLRSRTTAWLCESCRNQDPAWTAPLRSASPGMADTKLAQEVQSD